MPTLRAHMEKNTLNVEKRVNSGRFRVLSRNFRVFFPILRGYPFWTLQKKKFASCRECLALRARNAEKISKRSSRACQPGVPKECRKRRKSIGRKSPLSMPALQRQAEWTEKRLSDDLRQSVPPNGRVHLHIF